MEGAVHFSTVYQSQAERDWERSIAAVAASFADRPGSSADASGAADAEDDEALGDDGDITPVSEQYPPK
eukprot:1124245-Prorocentrum_lima.AAC.1